MSFNIKTISVFERQAKRLVKKYPSFKKELLELINELKENPQKGVCIGNNCYKIRMAVASKGKGRRGGIRLITHLFLKDSTVYLLSVYDKSDIDSLTDNEIIELVNMIPRPKTPSSSTS